MAYGLKKIPVVDLKPSTAIGVKLPFSAKNVFTSVYTTKEQTKYNLINFLLTGPRETPMVSNFGAGLKSLLFESITESSMESVKQSILSKVENNFRNVQVTDLTVDPDFDNNSVVISFSYRLINSNESDILTIQIQS